MYTNVDSLKNAIANSFCKNKNKNIVVIVAEKPNGAASSEIGELLLKIGTDNSYVIRKNSEDKAIDSYFAVDFNITMRYNDASSVVAKEFKNGKYYLDMLASNRHLSDVEVGNIQKDNNGKITHIDIVEIQKKDIDVQIK